MTVAWLSAMLEYPPVEPQQMRCPTLWLVGTANPGALDSAKALEGKLVGTHVSLELLDGLTHAQEFERIELALPKELAFTRAHL